MAVVKQFPSSCHGRCHEDGVVGWSNKGNHLPSPVKRASVVGSLSDISIDAAPRKEQLHRDLLNIISLPGRNSLPAKAQ
jgi:hypothetical protein